MTKVFGNYSVLATFNRLYLVESDGSVQDDKAN